MNNLKLLTISELKTIGLEILQSVHDFCEENGLKYILFYGSLLGAVRHKGYIPWDDDIDIAMPRDDYLYFIKYFDNENYGVKSCYNDKFYFLPWAKAYDKHTLKIEPIKTHKKFNIGFNIDVFPLDFVSEGFDYWQAKNKERKLIKKLKNGMLIIDNGSFLKNLLKRLVRFFYYKKCNKYSQTIDNFFINYDKTNKTKKLLVSNSIYDGLTKKYVFPLGLFQNRLKMAFENKIFYIPRNYDEVLKIMFDNYLDLPAKAEQVTHHTFKAYKTDSSISN